MSKRVCSRPGCPTLVDAGARGGRCPRCEREHDRARGTRQQRGYDTAYDRALRDWERRLAEGERVLCWRCLEDGVTTVIDGSNRDSWDLGHDDQDRSVIRGPECRGPNRATSARRISPDAYGVGVPPPGVAD